MSHSVQAPLSVFLLSLVRQLRGSWPRVADLSGPISPLRPFAWVRLSPAALDRSFDGSSALEMSRPRGAQGIALPWRILRPPSPLTDGALEVAGRKRRLSHVSHVERLHGRWWREGALRTERFAWAEVEGPLLVLLKRRTPRRWEAIAWLD